MAHDDTKTSSLLITVRELTPFHTYNSPDRDGRDTDDESGDDGDDGDSDSDDGE